MVKASRGDAAAGRNLRRATRIDTISGSLQEALSRNERRRSQENENKRGRSGRGRGRGRGKRGGITKKGKLGRSTKKGASKATRVGTAGPANNQPADQPSTQPQPTQQQPFSETFQSESLVERGFRPGGRVALYVSQENQMKEVGKAVLSQAGIGKGMVRRKLHGHDLPHDSLQDIVVITKASINEDSKDIPYPYSFQGFEDCPSNLLGLSKWGFYAWDTWKMFPIPEDLTDEQRIRPGQAVEEDIQPSHQPQPQPQQQQQPPTQQQQETEEIQGLEQENSNSNETDTITPILPPVLKKRPADSVSILPTKPSKQLRIETDEIEFVGRIDESDNRGKKVHLKEFDINNYFDVDTTININQTFVPDYTVRDIDPAHCDNLLSLFLSNGFDYAAGRMLVTVRRSDNPLLESLSPEVLLDDGSLDPNLNVLVVDGLHRRETIIKCKDEKNLQWAQEPIKMILKIRKDGMDMTDTEIIALGLRQNNSTSAVRKAFRNFSDRIYTVVSYFKSFMKDYKISNPNEIRVLDVASSIAQASVFRDNSQETCRRYVRIGKVFLKHPEALQVLKSLDESLNVTIGASHIDEKIYHSLDKEGVILFLEAVGNYINNQPEASRNSKGGARGAFPSRQFHTNINNMYEICRNLYNLYGRSQKLSFTEFLSVEVPITKSKTVSVRKSFLNQARLFEFGKKKNEAENNRRIQLFETRVRKAFQPTATPQPSPSQSITTPSQSNPSLSKSKTTPSKVLAAKSSLASRKKSKTNRYEPDPIYSPATRTNKSKSKTSAKRGSEGDNELIIVPASPEEEENLEQVQDEEREMDTQAQVEVEQQVVGEKTGKDIGQDGGENKEIDVEQDTTANNEKEKEVEGQSEQQNQPLSADQSNLESAASIIMSFSKSNIEAAVDPVSTENAEEPDPSTEIDNNNFDDLIPPKLPVGFEDPPVYKGEKSPSWTAAVLLPPVDSEKVLESCKDDLHATPWLECINVPNMHRANWFFNVPYLNFLQRMAWLISCKIQLSFIKNLYSASNAVDDSWENSVTRYESGYGAAYFMRNRELLLQRGYTILEGFADFSNVPQSVISQVDKNKSYQSKGDHSNGNVQELFNFFMSTFPGEEKLKEEKNRRFWNPIINTGDMKKDTDLQTRGVARYSSTRLLLMDELEDSDEKIWAAVSRASLDVWVAQATALLQIRQDSDEKLSIPQTGGRFLITGTNCPRQIPHNDFCVRDFSNGMQPGYFAMVSGKEGFPLWVCDFSHNFVLCSEEEKKHFASSTKLRLITVPPFSILIAHGFLTHAGAGHRDRIVDGRTMRYHLYIRPNSQILPDAINFAFGSDCKFKLEENN